MALTKITGEGVGAVDNLTVGTTAGDAGASLTINKSPVAAHGNPLVQVGGSTFTSGGYYTVGLGFTNSTYTEPPAEIAYVSQSDSGGTKGDIVFGTRDVTTNTAVSTRMTIDSSGNVGIGNSSPSHLLDATVSSDSATARFGTTDSSGNNHGTVIISNGGTGDAMLRFDYEGSNTDRARIGLTASGQQLEFYTAGNNKRMQIDSGGSLTIPGGDTSPQDNSSGNGLCLTANGEIRAAVGSSQVADFNRMNNDGTVIMIRQAGTAEGSIEVNGSTVSLNGGHLSRWSQTTDGQRISGLLRGTVMTNLDQMAVWSHDEVLWTEDDELPDGVSVGDVRKAAYTEDNEQLNCMAVSSVEGDTNVAGVFQGWDESDDFNDMTVAMTGDFIIRIAQGTTVARGDLLMSAGDGTAKPQGDGYVQDKTIAKVTSTTVSHTYDDGSYLVPCVLMAC